MRSKQIKLRPLQTINWLQAFAGGVISLLLVRLITSVIPTSPYFECSLVLIVCLWAYFSFFELPILISNKKISYWLTKKPDPNRVYQMICQDGTRILRESEEVTQSTFTSIYFSRRYHRIFISLTITAEVNFIQLAILGKLRQLQCFFFMPVIYLVSDKKNNSLPAAERSQIEKCFIRLIKFYLRERPYELLNGHESYSTESIRPLHSLNNLELGILLNTTLGEIKNVLKEWRKVDDETYLLDIMMPIIEILHVYSIQADGTSVICGDNLLEFWRFGHKKLGINPIIFRLPQLINLQGIPVSPRNPIANLNYSWADRETAKRMLDGHKSTDSILQIYDFFITAFLGLDYNLEIKRAGGNIHVNSPEDIRYCIQDGRLSIDHLIDDLKERLPAIMQIVTGDVFGRTK